MEEVAVITERSRDIEDPRSSTDDADVLFTTTSDVSRSSYFKYRSATPFQLYTLSSSDPALGITYAYTHELGYGSSKQDP